MKIHLPLLGLAALMAVTSAAEARDRWQFKRYNPWADRYTYYDDNSGDDSAYYDEVDPDEVIILNRRQRAARIAAEIEARREAVRARRIARREAMRQNGGEENLWWLEEEARQALEARRRGNADAEPVIRQKAAPNKLASRTVTPTPVPKPLLKAPVPKAKVPASTETASVAPVKPLGPVKPAPATSKLETASISPPATPKGKTIGCTAGAAIVTGYGFGTVSPKACTGTTYSYSAQRGGKNYVIQLTAATGEITDVKKLN